MDELPELLVETVGGETVLTTVDIGGGDFVAVTPARTHLYRSEGLLSDESVESHAHDVERFATDPGRRKTTILLQNLDSEESFAVPSSAVDDVVAAMLEGILRTAGVVADDETIEAQFRFSELTLVVTGRQLLKHIGSAVWDDEFEAYRYDDLAGLDFEEGSVATQVVLETDGRQQRVKVPNDHAGRVRQEIQSSIFEYHDVSSLGGLRAAVAENEADGEEDADTEADSTTDDAAQDGNADAEPEADDEADDGFVSADWSPPADQDMTRTEGRSGGADAADAADTEPSTAEAESATAAGTASVTDVADPGATGAGNEDAATDADALAERVDALAERVDYQTELIETQQETIEQLVEELRRGR